MKKIALLLGSIALFATNTYATPVINQSSNGNTTPVDSQIYSYISTLETGNYGAVFTANTTTLDGAGIYLSDPNGGGLGIDPSAVFTVGLYNSSATLLGSGSFTNATGGWHDVFFNDVSVNIGSQYFVFASADSLYAGATTYQQYPNPGSLAYLQIETITEYYPNGYTIDARIFTDDGNTSSPVPEPGTIALLGLGIAGLAIYGKRRQKNA